MATGQAAVRSRLLKVGARMLPVSRDALSGRFDVAMRHPKMWFSTLVTGVAHGKMPL
jgi:hypothetical protein